MGRGNTAHFEAVTKAVKSMHNRFGQLEATLTTSNARPSWRGPSDMVAIRTREGRSGNEQDTPSLRVACEPQTTRPRIFCPHPRGQNLHGPDFHGSDLHGPDFRALRTGGGIVTV